jgi:hypothetical protein
MPDVVKLLESWLTTNDTAFIDLFDTLKKLAKRADSLENRTCSRCGKVFPRAWSCHRHIKHCEGGLYLMTSHQLAADRTCVHYGIIFDSIFRKEKHLKGCFLGRKYPERLEARTCSICGKVFTRSSARKSHEPKCEAFHLCRCKSGLSICQGCFVRWREESL